MAAFAIRNYIRIQVLKQFSAEDFLLLLAAASLSAATALTYVTMPYQYNALQVVLEGDPTSLWKLVSKLPRFPKKRTLQRLYGGLSFFL